MGTRQKFLQNFGEVTNTEAKVVFTRLTNRISSRLLAVKLTNKSSVVYIVLAAVRRIIDLEPAGR